MLSVADLSYRAARYEQILRRHGMVPDRNAVAHITPAFFKPNGAGIFLNNLGNGKNNGNND